MAQCADTAAGRRRFVEHLDSRAREDGVRAGVIEPGEDRRHSHLRHGWYWGNQAFAERMLQFARKGIATRKNRTYRSAPLFRAHDEKQAQRLLDGGLAAAGLSTRELDSLPGSDVRKGGLGKFALRTNGSEAELDRRQTGDAQRCERESTGSPIPYTETETGGYVQGVS